MYSDSKNPSFKEVPNYAKEGLVLERQKGDTFVDVWCRCVGRISVSLSHPNVSVCAGDWIEFDCSQPPGRGQDSAVYKNGRKQGRPIGLSLSQWTQGEALAMNDIGIIGAFNGDQGELWTASLGLVSFTSKECALLDPLTTVYVKARAVVPGFGAGGIGDPIAWNATHVDPKQLTSQELEVLMESLMLVENAEVKRWISDHSLRLFAKHANRDINLIGHLKTNFWMTGLKKRSNNNKCQDIHEYVIKRGQTLNALICPLPSQCHSEGVEHWCLFVAPETKMRILVGNSHLNFRKATAVVTKLSGDQRKEGSNSVSRPSTSSMQSDKMWEIPKTEVNFKASEAKTPFYPVQAWLDGRTGAQVKQKQPKRARSMQSLPTASVRDTAPVSEPKAKAQPTASKRANYSIDSMQTACSALFEALLHKRPDILAELVDVHDRKIVFERLFERKTMMLNVLKDDETKSEMIDCLKAAGHITPSRNY